MASLVELLSPFAHLFSPGGIEKLVDLLSDLKKGSQRDWLYEVEIRSHFVVPLLRELGWTPDLMKMEWANADIVLLSQPFRTLDNQKLTSDHNRPLVHTVIELKAPHITDLVAAHKQCRDYGNFFSNANRFVTTNGQHWVVEINNVRCEFDLFKPTAEAVKVLASLARSQSGALATG